VLKLTNGTRITADYPRASTPPAFESPLAEGAVREDTGSFWSRWAIAPLLPFALLVALVILLANRRQSRISNEDLRAS
jgi:hypothetical protein